MQGHFYKRGATWTYLIDIGNDPATGRRKQKSKGGFKTKKEAQLAAAELQKELSDGTYFEERAIPFKDFAKEWLGLYEENVKESTVRVRMHEIGCLNHYFKELKLNSITKRAYQNALIDMKKRGYAENTIAGVHGAARMIFKQAVEYDMLKVDPTQYAKLPKTKQTVEDLENEDSLPKYLEKHELSLFLKTAQEKGWEGDYEIFLTLAYTGLRAGELCPLKKSDMNAVDNTLNITKTYYNPTNNIRAYKLQTPKTKSSIRTIEVDPIVIKALEKLIAKQSEVKMRYRKTYHDKDFIFTSIKYPGYPIYIKFIENRMARILKQAGLSAELTPHSLRHTHTSLLAEAGASLEAIMERLGHSDDEVTKKVYLHVTKAVKKETSQKFSELMRSL